MASVKVKNSGGSSLLVPISIIISGLIIAVAVVVKDGSLLGGAGQEAPVAVLEESPKAIAPEGQVAGARVDVSVDDDPAQGPVDAPVTIIDFSDYQCPFCKRYFDETYPLIAETYGDQIRYVFRDYPLAFHANAQETSEAAQCAFDQASYWEYHDLLFENQAEWADETEITTLLEGYAADLSLDVTEFSDCLVSGKYTEEVKQDFADGQAAGVQGTPSFFINGRLLVGAQPFEAFQQIIDEELAAVTE